ncbi:Solute carrier family 35 member B1 [Thelohanellus kitauei]|uniref:Solute carrier family 35 member B1 n=1 Tax=Thelohanellus kitauei TaxID=669202 RepID=A0A0C2MG17_THEKT|nr:Solute carrier family 35 member B1 [Thelohanellus kitauei]
MIKSLFQLFASSMGYIIITTIHGLYLEKITIPEKDNTRTSFLYLYGALTFYSFLCTVFSLVCLRIFSLNMLPSINKLYLVFGSIFHTLTTTISLTSLAFVAYPVHILVKSIKPPLFMVFLVFFSRRRFRIDDLLCGIFISVGVIVFMDDKISTFTINNQGNILLLLCLLFDALNCLMIDKLKTTGRFNEYQYMFWANFVCMILNIMLFILFCALEQFEKLLLLFYISEVFLYSFTGILSQLLNYLIVRWFGPLVGTIVATMRKFISVFASIIIFKHRFTPNRLLGIFMVIMGSIKLIHVEITA